MDFESKEGKRRKNLSRISLMQRVYNQTDQNNNKQTNKLMSSHVYLPSNNHRHAVLCCVCSCYKIGHHNSCNGAANIHPQINFQKMTILSQMCLSFLHQIWSNKSLDLCEQFISETMPTCGLYLQLMFGTR